MRGRAQLGAPVEVPWWVIPLGLPPLAVAALAPFLPTPGAVRLIADASSLLLLAAVVWVALRVNSRNLQSVWISSAYALWFFVAIGWGAEVLRGLGWAFAESRPPG